MDARTIDIANPDDFPIELLIAIFSYADLVSLCNIALTCHAFYESANDKLLWQMLCKKHGFDLQRKDAAVNTKEFFKTENALKTYYLLACESTLPAKKTGLSFFSETVFNTPYTLEQLKKILSVDCLVFTDIEIETVREIARNQCNADGNSMLIFETRCPPDMSFKEINFSLYGQALQFMSVDPATLDILIPNIRSLEMLTPNMILNTQETLTTLVNDGNAGQSCYFAPP